MVERTAHNGLVTGSNPVKPKMTNNKLSIYQLKRLKQYLKNTNLIFFFFLTNLNSKNQLKLEQKLFKKNLKLFKIKNTLIKKVLKKSVFVNFSIMVKGPLCIIELKDSKKLLNNFNDLKKLNPSTPLISLKLNKKIYTINQLKTITTLNYKTNVKVLNKTLKRFLKLPYYKFKSK